MFQYYLSVFDVIPQLFSRTPLGSFFFFHHSHRRTQHHTEYQTLSACHHEADEVGHGKTVRDFREYESGITLAVNDVTVVLMEGISSGIPSFALLTKISWEFYCKQEKLFV